MSGIYHKAESPPLFVEYIYRIYKPIVSRKTKVIKIFENNREVFEEGGLVS